MNANTALALPGHTQNRRLRRLDLGASFAIALLAHGILLWAKPSTPATTPSVEVERVKEDFSIAPAREEVLIEEISASASETKTAGGGDNAPSIDPRELVDLPGPITLPIKPEWVRPTEARLDLSPRDYGSPSLRPSHESGEGGPGTVYSVTNLDRVPEPISRPSPRFPAQVQQETEAATVRAQFVVLADGTVGHIVIVSSTHPGCNAEVERALLRWKFKPGWKNNRRVATRMEQVFEFRDEGSR